MQEDTRIKRLNCAHCGRFLGREDLREGKVELYCPSCKHWTIIIARKEDTVNNINND
jgi:phage FluMu protein Com